MKKLIDISEEYLAPLKKLSESESRSVKKQIELIIYDELREVVAKRDPEIVKARNLRIDKICQVFANNGDSNKPLKFVCLADGIVTYKLSTKEYSYTIEVDNETVLPKSAIGYIIYHNSHSEAYIDFTCTNKKTGAEIKVYHGGYLLADEKLESKGLIRE